MAVPAIRQPAMKKQAHAQKGLPGGSLLRQAFLLFSHIILI